MQSKSKLKPNLERLTYLLVFFFFTYCTSPSLENQHQSIFLKEGDLLFQDLDDSPLCDAIESVTSGYKNGNFSHIGIVVQIGVNNCKNPDYNFDDDVKIIEALPNKVRITTLNNFLNRSFDKEGKSKVIVGRLKKKYRQEIEAAVSFVKEKVDEPYDEVFAMNNNAFYCSELIYKAFEKDSIFNLKPMTFSDPLNQKITKIWKDYYADLNESIPEGKLGINPGDMSLSNKIEIIYYYGTPSGMESIK